MIKATFRIGITPIQVEAASLKELFAQTELISQLPSCCGKCTSKDIRPGFSKNSSFEFFFLRCSECGYEFKLGQRKSDGGLFPKFSDGWKPPFKRSEEEDESAMPDAGGYDDE